jgi:hypothetical protein
LQTCEAKIGNLWKTKKTQIPQRNDKEKAVSINQKNGK